MLSRLGVDIGPLLAGFGILGLAISFGSQALVRDIVSGFFFMVEDAFRVGEYVDTGKLKGTVEKISLRSMQLRHQSGQIHTVPFGQIPSLTNSSRDWATVKFNVRLDHSADIEKARKTIKKIGLAMLEDPEFGPHFIAPLKMQGVAEIADTAHRGPAEIHRQAGAGHRAPARGAEAGLSGAQRGRRSLSPRTR